MFRFNRLFWKIFLSLWLSSVIVMMVTALVIGELAEENSLKSRLDFKVRLQAERFLEKFETNSQFRKKVQEQLNKKNSFWYKRRHNIPPMKIYNEQNVLIAGGSKRPKGDLKKITVISESGARYRVDYFVLKPQDFLAHWKGFILSVQALLILLSSTLFSFIVSAIVVKPMNELRHYVKRLKEGDFSVRVADKLQGRGDEVGDLAREFNLMAEYVENTLVSQQRLFQNVSHELRAPLARLLAASGIVEQQIGTEHPALDRIQLECGRLGHLIDELLSLAKLQQQSPANSAVDVCEIVEKVVADSLFSEPHRKISLHVDNNTDCIALGSVALLERALSNILGNALKHTASDSRINVYLTNPDSHRIQIMVEDNGEGVAESELTKICDPFFRLDTNVDGHGLGLGIARQAMLSQQGDLVIENVLPHGLSVKLILNLVKSH